MKNNLLSLVCALAIFMQPLFFSFMGLLGIEYEGSDSSTVYIASVVIIAGLSLVAYIYSTFIRGILRGEAIILAIIVGLFALHALWVIFDPLNTPLVPEFLVFFLLFGLPGFLSASTAIKLGILPSLVKISELFVILIAVGIVLYAVLPSLAGIRTASLAGASYQTLSYYAAFSFGMLLAYNLHLPRDLRLRITSHSWYRLGSYALMLGCVFACFLGGGRGAFLLLLTYLFMAIVTIFFNKRNILTKRGLVNTALKLASVILVVTVFITMFSENDFVQAGFNRATQFISSDGGIDFERGSSGRDMVYRIALEYIEQRPLLGYGPFGFRGSTIHAHNVFLEVWLQFGIVGLLIFLAAGVGLIVRTLKNQANYKIWVISLALYPAIMTMFSGTYMHTAIFIFAVSFVTIFNKDKRNRNSNHT